MPSSLTPEQRSLRAKIAVETSWANTSDRAARTAAARAASPTSLTYWERKIDPDRAMPAAERRERAAALHRAHMARMSYQRSRKATAAKSAKRRAS